MDWLPSLPSVFLHRQISLCSLETARALEKPMFVKPAEGKVFEPKVYSRGSGLPEISQEGDILVLVSDPVTFTLEVRCFVNAGKVVTSSPYWRNEALAQAPDGSWPFLGTEQEESLAFASEVLNHPGVTVPPAFVLDIGITSEHGWAVIEGNPCWGAGLYGCDPLAALETGRHALRRPDQLRDDDRRWISRRRSDAP